MRLTSCLRRRFRACARLVISRHRLTFCPCRWFRVTLVFFGALGVAPPKLLLGDKSNKKNGLGQTVSTGPTQTPTKPPRKRYQHHITKPPPKPDRTRDSQARLAFSSYWVGSALFCLAYPTGSGGNLSDIPTGLTVFAGVTENPRPALHFTPTTSGPSSSMGVT